VPLYILVKRRIPVWFILKVDGGKEQECKGLSGVITSTGNGG